MSIIPAALWLNQDECKTEVKKYQVEFMPYQIIYFIQVYTNSVHKIMSVLKVVDLGNN